jgi:N6-L-threonylcarbamoyladenine synthase
MLILGIESSCDETGAAVVSDGRYLLSNVVASQAEIHERYGGVVPEVASRQQLATIIPVIETALEQSGAQWSDLDGIAATYGPGLAGSLLIGLTAAKTLSLARNLPFIGINHLEAHIYANWLRKGDPVPPRHLATRTFADATGEYQEGDPRFPALSLVVSGAHTELVLIRRHGHYELLGRTRDDAAGEAFDKVARILGLGYPGGPAIQKAAGERRASTHPYYRLPRAWLRGTYDFSFSGLKTAVLHIVQGAQGGSPAVPAESDVRGHQYVRQGAQAAGWGGISVPDMAAAFQDAVVDVLATKTKMAAEEHRVAQVLLAGGVAANSALRKRLELELKTLGIPLSSPPIEFCTDNAAMIGVAGYFHLRLGERDGLDLDVKPGLQLPFAS